MWINQVPVSLRRIPAAFVMTVVLMAPSFSRADDPAPKLRYGFKPQQEYQYSIKIVGTLPDQEEVTLQGVSTYTVRSADDRQIVLNHSGSLIAVRKSPPPAPGEFPLPPRIMSPFMQSDSVFAVGGEVKIDPSGKPISSTVNSAVPFMLGDLQFFVLDELPEPPKNQWDKKSDVVLTQRSQQNPRFGPHFAPHFGPHPNNTGPRSNATEVLSYRVAGVNGNEIKIEKKFNLTTEEQVNGEPKQSYTGAGDLLFDSAIGVPRSLSMKYTLVQHEGNVTIQVPVSVTYHLLTPEEIAANKAAAEEVRKKNEAVQAEANRIIPLAAGELDGLLKDIKTGDTWAVQKAAKRLSKATVNDRQKEVSAVLTPRLKDRDVFIKHSVANALVVWAADENLADFIKAAGDDDLEVRKSMFQILEKHKTKEAAEAIVQGLIPGLGRGDAAKALVQMGSIAEGAVAKILNDRDGWVRKEACRILEQIGTKESLPALQEYAGKATGFDKSDAEKAIKAIRERG
jgi:hypothetical protein